MTDKSLKIPMIKRSMPKIVVDPNHNEFIENLIQDIVSVQPMPSVDLNAVYKIIDVMRYNRA